MLRPREAVRTLPSYHPPLAGRGGLRLDFNENTSGCSPRVLDRVRGLDPEALLKYPEREPVEAMVAEFLKLSPPEVLLTNGVDEAIHLLCETYLEPGDVAVIVVPTYSMYRIYAMAAGAEVVSVEAGKEFAFPAKELSQRVSKRTRLICIANPNNPTGTVADPKDLLQIARSVPEAAVLVDEAYFEFYGKTMLAERSTAPNLFVARTFSKAYGLAGLRLGVLAGDAEQMKSVRRVASPYNVNAVALACLPAALADQEHVTRYVNEVLEGRRRLEAFLKTNDVPFWRSEANFILMRAGETKGRAAKFVSTMRERGILVRDRSSDPGCEGCVRITLGLREQVDRLLVALPEALHELGVGQGARL